MTELLLLFEIGDKGNMRMTALCLELTHITPSRPINLSISISQSPTKPIHLPALFTIAGIHSKTQSESDRKEMQDKYCVLHFLSLFIPIVFNTDKWTMKAFWTFSACYLLVMSSEPCCLSPRRCGGDWFMQCHVFLSSPGETLVSEILFWTHRLRNDWLGSSLIIKVGFKIQNLKKVIILKRQPNASRA